MTKPDPELFSVFKLHELEKQCKCDHYLCEQKATHYIGVHYCRSDARYYANLCPEHIRVLENAYDLLAFLMDMKNMREGNIDETIQRERQLDRWAREFMTSTFADSGCSTPDDLAKRAYEFAHAMLGRKLRYKSVLIGSASHGEGPSAYGLSYHHDGELLTDAAKTGLW